VLHGILQVLHDALLADDLLYSRLGLDVEGVRIQQLDLASSLLALPPLPVLARRELARKPLRILQRGHQIGPRSRQLAPQVGVAQNLQPDHLWVLLNRRPRRGASPALLCRPGGALDRRAASHVADVQGEHVAVGNAELGQRLGVVCD
jgi:hypothetical protein